MISLADLIAEHKACRSLSRGDRYRSLCWTGIGEAIYDLKTERRPYTSLAAKLAQMKGIDAKVENPAGQITNELVREIASALERNVPTQHMVEGEEDLAALACVAMAPLGSCLVYGVPGKGMAMIRVDQEAVRQARSMIDSMEELN